MKIIMALGEVVTFNMRNMDLTIICLPAEDEMSVKAASVHSSVFRVDDPPCVSGREVDGCLASLFGLGALMRGEERERRARGHRVFAA